MSEALNRSIVRIFRQKDNQPVGAGVLVGDGKVLTCAHVVNSALGLPQYSPEQPPEEALVRFDFPLVSPGTVLAGRVVVWHPPSEDSGGDIAGLEIVGGVPDSTEILHLVVAENYWDHAFRVMGFPGSYADGVWADGVLRDRTGRGWIQIEDIHQTGYFVTQGFSGTPVWDEDVGGVVGIVVAAERREQVRAAFIIPAAIILQAWPDLRTDNNPVKVQPAGLENPTGAVPPGSPFYIERPADQFLHNQARSSGTITTIHAGRQAGKTSLLMQALHIVREANQPVVFLDFQTLESTQRETLDSLAYYMASEIAFQQNIDQEAVDRIWKSPRSAANKLNQFLRSELLSISEGSILLAIDEADQLAGASYKKDFFALLRSWNSLQAYDDVWRRLNLVMVISTHPYMLIDDVNQSPFNVGLTIIPEDFTQDQVRELNRRHGSPLPPEEISVLMDLVGGHPYLVRKAFYSLATKNWTLENLLKNATNTRDGPFRGHLRFYRDNLAKNPELLNAMRQIISSRKCLDEVLMDRLIAVGLVRETDAGCEPRCGLYEDYFKKGRFS